MGVVVKWLHVSHSRANGAAFLCKWRCQGHPRIAPLMQLGILQERGQTALKEKSGWWGMSGANQFPGVPCFIFCPVCFWGNYFPFHSAHPHHPWNRPPSSLLFFHFPPPMPLTLHLLMLCHGRDICIFIGTKVLNLDIKLRGWNSVPHLRSSYRFRGLRIGSVNKYPTQADFLLHSH